MADQRILCIYALVLAIYERLIISRIRIRISKDAPTPTLKGSVRAQALIILIGQTLVIRRTEPL